MSKTRIAWCKAIKFWQKILIYLPATSAIYLALNINLSCISSHSMLKNKINESKTGNNFLKRNTQRYS